VSVSVDDDGSLPVWARDDAFPKAPNGCGWVDGKGRLHPCQSETELIRTIAEDRNADVELVWTPSSPWMVLPEQLSGAAAAITSARRRRAAEDMEEARDRLRWFGFLFGAVVLWLVYQVWQRSTGLDGAALFRLAWRVVTGSGSVGIALLMFLIFAFIPWYQARKLHREVMEATVDDVSALVPPLRFETWLLRQNAPLTQALLAIIALIGIAQLLRANSINTAGLVKSAYTQGEWWRLFTAPLLHGHIIHFLMNAAALKYLGKRVEVFAGWPHLAMVFLFSALIGGVASVAATPATSVGSSGGLMGLLGFLLVFEWLHKALVPRSNRRRLIAGVLLTGLIGLIGYRLIDNAAHVGGLMAGMAYAALVFPPSASAMRPKSTPLDSLIGGTALAILAASAWYALTRIL